MSNKINIGNREVIGAGTIIAEQDEVISILVETPPPPAISIDRLLIKIVFKKDAVDLQTRVRFRGESTSNPPTITVILSNWLGLGTALPTTPIGTRDSDGGKIYLALFAHSLGGAAAGGVTQPTRVLSYVLSVQK
jgi:hypothetical protein